MAPLRIAVITFDWYPYEVRALRLAEAAANAKYQVDVICIGRENEKRHEIHHGVHVYRIPMSRSNGASLSKRIFEWCWFLLTSGAIVTWRHLRHHYEVVHVHNMPDFLVFSALFPKLLGAKVILDIQDVSPELMGAKAKSHGRLRSLIIRLAIWQEHISTVFAHYIVTTGWLFEEILVKRGVPKEKITSILNSADPSLFPPERRCPSPFEASSGQEKPFIIMYYGTLAKRNGLDIAIRAIVLAHRVVPNLQLDIQGNGDYQPILEQLVTELDANDYVTFTESSAPDKLVDFAIHGDIGIIPYRNDGFANIILPTKAYEFAWMHRAIIASDTPAIRSMFRPESIILCDPSKPESFAAAIIDLYQNPEKRARIVANAAEDYIPYRWENMATSYQHLLASLCNKQPAEEKA